MLAASSVSAPYSFSLSTTELGYHLVLHGQLLAEVEVGTCRAFTWLGGEADPHAMPGGSLIAGRACIVTEGRASAELRGIDLHDWNADALGFVDVAAAFDGELQTGFPTRTERAEARALWPSVVYAFVRSGAKARELVVVAPPSTWVSARGTPDEEENPHVGSLAIVSVPLDDVRGTTVVLNLQASAIAGFRAGPPAFVAPSQSERMSRDQVPDEPPAATVVVDVEGMRVTTSVTELRSSAALDARIAPFARHATKKGATASGCEVVPDASLLRTHGEGLSLR